MVVFLKSLHINKLIALYARYRYIVASKITYNYATIVPLKIK